MKEKFPGKVLIDIKAYKNILALYKTASMMKYYYSMNHYSKRDKEVNSSTKIVECSRYSWKETWEYTVQCSQTTKMRIKFILKMYYELK